jgi:hypothetical protein
MGFFYRKSVNLGPFRVNLSGSGLDESNIQPLLSALDDEFLPDVDLEHGNLTYTVVLGEVLGNYQAEID